MTRATGFNVFVAAQAAADDTLHWLQLCAARNWSNLFWLMAQFMSGVSLSSRIDSVIIDILDNVDVSRLIGSRIYVGYGTDAEEMLQARRYREVMTITPPSEQL